MFSWYIFKVKLFSKKTVYFYLRKNEGNSPDLSFYVTEIEPCHSRVK